MQRSTRNTLLLALLLAPTVAFAPSCKSSEPARPALKTLDVSSQLVGVYEALTAELGAASTAVERLRGTVESQGIIRREKVAVGDLQAAYDSLGAAIGSLEKSQKSVVGARETLRKTVEKQLQQWDADIAAFESADLRATTQKRRDTAATRFATLSTELDGVATSVQGYLGRLSEVKRALANDLTPEGVGALDTILKDTAGASKPLTDEVGRAVAALREYAGTLSAKG